MIVTYLILLIGALLLLEFLILSVPYLYSFGFVKIKPSTAPGFRATLSGGDGKPYEKMSLWQFFCATLCWWDMYGSHTLRDDDSSVDITPLGGAKGSLQKANSSSMA